MNRIQCLFKHKTKSKLLLTAVAMLLIITMLPLTALGADGDMITLGVTTKGNSYNGSGVAGRTYGSDPERIWGKMTSDSTGKSKTAYDLIGYRVYIVDKAGNLQSKVVDITYRNPTDYSNKQDYTTTILCGTVDKSDVAKVKQVKAIRDKNKVMDITSATPEVFIARNGDYIVGQDLAHWMKVTDSNGHTNSKKLIQFAFKGEEILNKLDNGSASADTQDWQVIVEPLMYVDIWTQNCELVEFEETTEYEWYKEHCIVTRGDQAVDVCCSSTSKYCVTQTSKELLNYCAEMGTHLMIQRPLLYGTSSLTGAYATKLKEYYNAVSVGEANEKEAARQLGYGNNRTYNSLNDNEKIAVYNKLVSTGKALNPNTLYIKSKSDIIAYNVVNKVDNGNGEYVYADYSIAYQHKTGSNWDWVRPVTKNGKTYHKLSAYTGVRLYSTYTGVKNHLKTVPKLASTTPGSDGGCTKGKINDIGSGMHLSEEMVFTDASGKPTNKLAAGTNGIHMYPLSDIYDFGKPIHTYDVDTNPNIPALSEQPKEDKQNTGSTTIVKVYGHIYKDDSGKIHHISDLQKGTFVTTQATNEIIITDEYTQTGYKLTEWVATTTTSNKTNIKATDWATVTTDLKLSTSKMKNTLGVQSYSYSSSANGLTHGEDNPITLGEKDSTNTIYLLYLKSLPYIETSDKQTQFTPDPTQPNPTLPENPSNDKNNQNNPDKKGAFNIIKVYALLDEYNGTPLSYEIKPQKSTTPFIKIQTESNWTLASWYTTDKTNQSVTANDFLQKASTNDQLKQFYEKGFYLKTPSTATIGNIKSKGAIATTKYFNDGSNTIYLIYTRTKGQVNYNATEQLITESYLAKRFSTSGYWNVLGHFVINDLKLTVTTSTGTIEEDFKNHLFTVVNPKLNGGSWVDRDITFKVDCLADTNGSIIPSLSAIYRASGRSASGDPLPYVGDYTRKKITEEAVLFSDLEYRFTAYRKDDSVTLANWKINSGSTLHTDMRNNYTNSANAIRNATNNYFKLGNTASHMGWLFFLPKIRYIVTV